jgi:hypothetical protein
MDSADRGKTFEKLDGGTFMELWRWCKDDIKMDLRDVVIYNWLRIVFIGGVWY